MKQLYQSATRWFDHFLFESCDPFICSLIRIAFSILLLIYVTVWGMDASIWFIEGGVLRAETAQLLAKNQTLSLLFWLPSDTATVTTLLAILWLQSLLLLLGFWSRFQVACIFAWLVSFQHRNPLIGDGEDTVFRLVSFFMIFMPLDHVWSLGRWLRRVQSTSGPRDAWALRLVQFEITAIYLSTAWSKWQGATWQNGTALYYVSRMDDVFGRLWIPGQIFETAWSLKAVTWSVLTLETMLPFLLWYPRTRRLGLWLGIGLHLSIEYAMHLFLFEWIMMVCLLSFGGRRLVAPRRD